MTTLTKELRDLIEAGPLTHLSTINPDGSPQVTLIWIGFDGDDLVSGHMARHVKLRNIERDPRVVLSFVTPPAPGVLVNEYVMLRARATVESNDRTWELLNRLTKVYGDADSEFPVPEGPGYIVRYTVEQIGGLGPWSPVRH